MSANETRVIDETTGAAKGSKLAAMHLVPWSIITELAEHFGRGARKYAERNWEAGYKWSLSFAALHRHLAAFWGGEEIDDDPELVDPDGVSRTRHIVAVVWHACVLAYFSRYGVGTDDRPHLGTPSLAEAMPATFGRASAQPPIIFGGTELPSVPDVAGRDALERKSPCKCGAVEGEWHRDGCAWMGRR